MRVRILIGCMWSNYRSIRRRIHSVVVLDIFQTGVACIRWQKWFTETGQIITVTGRIQTVHTTTRAVLANTQLPATPKTHAGMRTRMHTHTHAHT